MSRSVGLGGRPGGPGEPCGLPLQSPPWPESASSSSVPSGPSSVPPSPGACASRGSIPGVLYGRAKPVAIAVAERDLRAALTEQGRHARRARRRRRRRRRRTRRSSRSTSATRCAARSRTSTSRRFASTSRSRPRSRSRSSASRSASRKAASSRRSTNEVNVEALPLEVPQHLEIDVSGMHIGDTLRLGELEVAGRRHAARRPRGDRARDRHAADPRRGARGAAEGEEGAEARGRGAERRRAGEPTTPPTAATAHLRGVAARAPAVAPRRHAPRRSTCSSSASATPAASTRATATTSATWSSTSSRAGTAARGAASSPGQLADVRIDGHRVALLKPETYMNESGRSVQAAAAFFKLEPDAILVVHDESDLDAGPAAGAARRRARGPQRPPLGRAAPRHARLPAAARRRRPARAAATGGRSPTTCSRTSSRTRTPSGSSRARPTRSRRSTPRGSRRRSAPSTANARDNEHARSRQPRAAQTRTGRRPAARPG